MASQGGFLLPSFISEVMTKDLADVRLVLDKMESPVDIWDIAGRTALYIAAARGREDIVALLLAYGANVNCQAKDRSTPLMKAICNKHTSVVKLLCSKGAKTTSQSVDGQTPLSWAISYGINDKHCGELALSMLTNHTHISDMFALDIEGEITLWEACYEARLKDHDFFRRLLPCIQTFGTAAKMNTPENIAKGTSIKWDNSFLSKLSLGNSSAGANDMLNVPAKIEALRTEMGMIPAPGPEFRARYMLENFVGNGAFSSAWKAIDLFTGKPVATKFFMQQLTERRRANAVTESELMEKLRHQNLLQIHEFLDKNNNPAFVTELAEYGDLHQYNRLRLNDMPMPELKAKNIFRQIMEGLRFMHDQNIVHQDLKYDNILVFEHGYFKIADFGNSRSVPTGGMLSAFYCTLPYKSPEAIRSQRVPEPYKQFFFAKPCDIYSAGVLLYTLLTNRCYLIHINEIDEIVGDEILKGDLHFDDVGLWGNKNKYAMHLIARMMHRNPDKRPRAHEVLQHPWVTGYFNTPTPLANLEDMRVPHAQRVQQMTPDSPEWLRVPRPPAPKYTFPQPVLPAQGELPPSKKRRLG